MKDLGIIVVEVAMISSGLLNEDVIIQKKGKKKTNIINNKDKLKNIYFIWYYIKNNIDLLESSYNTILDKDSKTINTLSIKSEKPVVRASTTLATMSKRITKEDFKLLSSYDYSKIELHYNETPNTEAVIFQDLQHLNISEIVDISRLKNKKIITTTDDKNLLHFDGYSAVKIKNNYILWN